MATDSDRQSVGLKTRGRTRALSDAPGGLHAAFQVAWLLAIAAPVASTIGSFAGRPTSGKALGVIAVSAVWALVASIAWGLRVVALSTSGRFGRRTRQRVRSGAGRRK
jgi:hypothetical protein